MVYLSEKSPRQHLPHKLTLIISFLQAVIVQLQMVRSIINCSQRNIYQTYQTYFGLVCFQGFSALFIFINILLWGSNVYISSFLFLIIFCIKTLRWRIIVWDAEATTSTVDYFWNRVLPIWLTHQETLEAFQCMKE